LHLTGTFYNVVAALEKKMKRRKWKTINSWNWIKHILIQCQLRIFSFVLFLLPRPLSLAVSASLLIPLLSFSQIFKFLCDVLKVFNVIFGCFVLLMLLMEICRWLRVIAAHKRIINQEFEKKVYGILNRNKSSKQMCNLSIEALKLQPFPVLVLILASSSPSSLQSIVHSRSFQTVSFQSVHMLIPHVTSCHQRYHVCFFATSFILGWLETKLGIWHRTNLSIHYEKSCFVSHLLAGPLHNQVICNWRVVIKLRRCLYSSQGVVKINKNEHKCGTCEVNAVNFRAVKCF
jgi:hypothetical protein